MRVVAARLPPPPCLSPSMLYTIYLSFFLSFSSYFFSLNHWLLFLSTSSVSSVSLLLLISPFFVLFYLSLSHCCFFILCSFVSVLLFDFPFLEWINYCPFLFIPPCCSLYSIKPPLSFSLYIFYCFDKSVSLHFFIIFFFISVPCILYLPLVVSYFQHVYFTSFYSLLSSLIKKFMTKWRYCGKP